MTILAAALAVCAVAAWLTAFYAFIRLSGHLSGRKSRMAMMFSGIAWFDPRNFTPEAAPMRRLLGYAFVAFFLCLVTGIVVSVIAAAPR